MHDWEDPRPFASIGLKAVLQSAIHRNGKTQKLQTNHRGCIRDIESLCAQFWLANHFCYRFVLDKVPYPDPNNKEDWTNRPQWATPRGKMVSYEMCRRSDLEAMERAAIPTSKRGHAWGMYSARQIDDAGCHPQEVARWCNWTQEVMYDSYLRSFSKASLMAAAGYTICEEAMFFSERFFIKVPDTLVADVAPYAEELAQRVRALENIGEPRPSLYAAVKVVRHLTMVLIQDAAAGLAEFPRHDVMSYLLGFQQFRELVDQHQADRERGVFEKLRPLRQHDRLHRIELLIEQSLAAADCNTSQPVAAVLARAASIAVRVSFQVAQPPTRRLDCNSRPLPMLLCLLTTGVTARYLRAPVPRSSHSARPAPRIWQSSCYPTNFVPINPNVTQKDPKG